MTKSRNAMNLLDRRVPPTEVDLEERAGFRQDFEVAQMLHDLRTEAGLSQRELAARVGTTASVICRMEDADYSGHSLTMLRRIAEALGQRVELRIVPGEASDGAA